MIAPPTHDLTPEEAFYLLAVLLREETRTLPLNEPWVRAELTPRDRVELDEKRFHALMDARDREDLIRQHVDLPALVVKLFALAEAR